jgi:putative ABC transport system permease protein
VGILEAAKKSADTSGFYFRYDYFDEARARGKGMCGWYTVKVKEPGQAAEVAKAIDAEFANSPYETKTEPEGAFMQGFAQQIGDVGTILIAILSAVFFTILLVAGNTMAQSVRERTNEFGVLKAMGFTDGLALRLVLIESCVMTGFGGFAGLGLSWLIASRGSPVPSMLPVFFLPARHLVIGAALVFALGLVAGIIPAVQAMRLQIAQSLRREG